MDPDPAKMLGEGLKYKEQGNAHFKAGEWRAAARSYRRVFAFVNGLVFEGDAMASYARGGLADPALKAQVSELKATTWKNLANVYLRTNEPERALECADKALEMSGGKDVKALLRRAQALSALKRYESAKEALARAHALEKDNEGVLAEIRKFNADFAKVQEERRIKEKALFGGKLSSSQQPPTPS